MTNQASQKRGLGLGEIWPLLFVVDELIEAWREMPKGKDGKAPETSGILWGLAKVVFFLVMSPFSIVAGAGWLMAHLLGFDPASGLRLIGALEVVFIVLLVIWAYKKLVRDPWSRVMKQTRLEYNADPSVKPGDLVSKVRNALGQDDRAAAKADDAVRKVLGQAQRQHAESQAPTRGLVIRIPSRGQKQKTDQPLARAPHSAVKRLGEQGKGKKSGWDIR